MPQIRGLNAFNLYYLYNNNNNNNNNVDDNYNIIFYLKCFKKVFIIYLTFNFFFSLGSNAIIP
jgi:hypothetical protein